MSENLTAKGIVNHPYFSMIFCLLVWFILPQYGGRYGGLAVMLACASVLSAHVAMSPELYCSRNGSMMTAACLVAAMWAAAVVVTVLSLMGVAY